PCDLALAICKARLCWYYVAHPGTTRDPPPFPTRRSSDLNPGASLPATDIVVVHRSDGSGTSYGFTDYLSKVSSDWAQKVGKGTSDRKSTRLNSSHLVISYAAFCLKKKMSVHQESYYARPL